MERYFLFAAVLFACAASVRAQEQPDRTGIVLGLGLGGGYEPVDLDAFNARVSGAGLSKAAKPAVVVRLDTFGHGRRLFLGVSETFGNRVARTDSSRVRSSVVNVQLCAGYPVVRNARMVLAPLVGYRLSQFSYGYSREPAGDAFDQAVSAPAREVQLAHVGHELVVGAFWSYGRKGVLAVQAGYRIPVGDGSWHSTGTWSKLDKGPTIEPGMFIGVSAILQKHVAPGK